MPFLFILCTSNWIAFICTVCTKVQHYPENVLCMCILGNRIGVDPLPLLWGENMSTEIIKWFNGCTISVLSALCRWQCITFYSLSESTRVFIYVFYIREKYFAANTLAHQRQFWYRRPHYCRLYMFTIFHFSQSVPWEIRHDLKINNAHFSMFTFLCLSRFLSLLLRGILFSACLHIQFDVFRHHIHVVRFNSVIYLNEYVPNSNAICAIKEDANPPPFWYMNLENIANHTRQQDFQLHFTTKINKAMAHCTRTEFIWISSPSCNFLHLFAWNFMQWIFIILITKQNKFILESYLWRYDRELEVSKELQVFTLCWHFLKCRNASYGWNGFYRRLFGFVFTKIWLAFGLCYY